MGAAKKVAIGVAVAVVVIVVLGVFFSFYGMYEAFRNLRVVEVGVEDVDVKGINPAILDFIPDEIDVTFYADVENPTNYDITIEKLHYTVDIEGTYAGGGVLTDILIPANFKERIRIPYTTTAGEVLKVVGKVISSGDTAVDYVVKGYMLVPVYVYGFRMTTLRIPFQQTGYFIIPVPGAKPKVEFISVYWSPSEISFGNFSVAVIQIKGPVKGKVEAVIKMDRILLPDKEVYRESWYVNIPQGKVETFKIAFKPPEPCSMTVRGYFVEIYINGEKVHVQPERLKVIG